METKKSILNTNADTSADANINTNEKVQKSSGLISERFVHPVPPLFDENSRILILGTFPSPKSRDGRFFYHHRQNRFWKVIAALANSPIPETIEQKKTMMLKNNIAVWDVILSCRITGAADSSIRDVVPTDLSVILNHAPVERIFANGGTAYSLYMKYSYPKTGRQITKLPSTSPANASWNLDRLIDAWSVILPF